MRAEDNTDSGCSEILEDLFSLCSDYGLVIRLIGELRSVIDDQNSLSNKLYECSHGSSNFSHQLRRNYILDLILQCSGLSQTYVQQHCGIGRLTHVATRELQVTKSQADDIVEVVFDRLNRSFTDQDLAEKYLQDRYYSICTHSYCSPLYFQALDSVLKCCPSSVVFGFPAKNSEVARCWHNNFGGGAGAIKVQFIIRDNSGNDKVLIRVCSSHEGHSADKRKEIAAKARLLGIRETPSGGKSRSSIRQILILDGDWRGPDDDPDRHLKMIHESGWDLIVGPDNIQVIEQKIREWVA